MRTQQLIQEALAWNQAIEQKVRTSPHTVDEALVWLKSAIEVVKATPVNKAASYRTRREEAAALLQKMQVYIPAQRYLMSLSNQLKARVPLNSLDLFRAHFFRNALQMPDGFTGFNSTKSYQSEGIYRTHRTLVHAETAWEMAQHLELLKPELPIPMLSTLQSCAESFGNPENRFKFLDFGHLLSHAKHRDRAEEVAALNQRKAELLEYLLAKVELTEEQHTLLKQSLS